MFQPPALNARFVYPGWPDRSQNTPAKTTVAPYSLRGRELPTVSTPVRWEEVHDCRKPGDLVFTSDDVLTRVDEFGDLFEEMSEQRKLL